MKKPTTIMSETFERIALNLIDPGPMNPRKTFDTPDWPEFVASVRTHGVIQPGLCRPSPVKPGRFELVAGERRYRASTEAKLADMPLIVRPLTDAEVYELQQIENLQREDLGILEEAQGYEDWAKRLIGQKAEGGTITTKEQAVAHICAKINKKRSHVWDRMRLLDTTPPVRQALESGKLDPSKAVLVAQVPKALQPQLTKQAVEGNYGSGPLSFRRLKELIEEEYRQPLKGAQFSLKYDWTRTDFMKPENLRSLDLPAGTVVNGGPCVACPMRAGNLPDAEDDDYTCTNPKCFEVKKRWHVGSKLFAARMPGPDQRKGAKDGRRIIEPKEYQKNPYTKFEKADDKCYEDDKSRTWAVLGRLAGMEPLLTANAEWELIEVYPKEDLAEIRKFHKFRTGGGDYEASRKADLVRSKKKKEAVQLAMRAARLIVPKLATEKGVDDRVWRLMADRLNDRLDIESQSFVAKSRGLAKVQGEVRDGLDKWLTDKKRTTVDFQGFILEALLLSQPITGYNSAAVGDGFKNVARLAGVDLETLKEKDLIEKTLPKNLKEQWGEEAINDLAKARAEGRTEVSKASKAKKPKQQKLFK